MLIDNNNQTQNKMPLRQKIALLIFGLFLTLIVLEAGLRLGGFIILYLQEHRNRLSIQKKGTYRIMCLGESTTADNLFIRSYPYFLEEVLNRRSIGIKFIVINKGALAINTSYILDSLEYNLEAYHPDMVITMMGINDWGAHIPYEFVSDSKAINFLKSFRAYKLTRLLWLHIVTRLKESKSDRLSEYTAQPKFLFQRGELQQVYTKKKAIELNPKNDMAYVDLGRLYLGQSKFSEAEASFKKAIELNPKNDMAYVGLGRVYLGQSKLSEAEASFKKAIELNPKNDMAYVDLGQVYLGPKAEASFKKAIELNPKNDIAYVDLGRVYLGQRKPSKAEASFKKAIELNPKNDIAYGALKVLYIEMGNSRLAREYDKKAKELGLSYYLLMTVGNYHKLKAILDKRGIVYVCVQYPMRNLEPLKKIFQGNTEGIIFIDNEKIFKDALKQGSYWDYFRDTFGGDFGHCTNKGDRLLAENIANVIIKEVFGK